MTIRDVVIKKSIMSVCNSFERAVINPTLTKDQFEGIFEAYMLQVDKLEELFKPFPELLKTVYISRLNIVTHGM